VSGDAPVIVPPPDAMLKVTCAPENGLPFWSRMMTDGGGVTAVPATPVMVVAVFAAIVVAAAGSVFPSPLQSALAMRRSAEKNL
jgi:hypothetical protein